MAGLLVLYVDSGSNEVIKVPQPKEGKFKAIKKFANQEILRVMLFYETKERKPSKLIRVEFSRKNLDQEGAYYRNREVDRNAYDFAFATPEDLAQREAPLTLPTAPHVPTSLEKRALYDFLTTWYPILGKEAPYFIEGEIRDVIRIHREKIELVKEANRLRNII